MSNIVKSKASCVFGGLSGVCGFFYSWFIRDQQRSPSRREPRGTG